MLLPDDFKRQMQGIIGERNYNDLAEAIGGEPTTSIRINRAKLSSGVPFQELIDGEVGWCSDGYYLRERPLFTLDALFHGGAYYVQEASSMFLDHVVKCLSDDYGMEMVLDLCAAPGGKSTILRANMPTTALLMANEIVPKRASILSENLIKQGYRNNIVTCSTAKNYAESHIMFDFILCDVPCSGEGMFRKDAGSIGEWSLAGVEHCRELQREIVADAWKCLKKGGILVYSTCTLNTRENEENVKWMIEEFGAMPVEIPIKQQWGITGSVLNGFDKPVYRFIPGRTRGEGLFMAVLKKCGETDIESIKPSKHKKAKDKNKKNSIGIDVERYLSIDVPHTILKNDDKIMVIDSKWTDCLNVVKQYMKVINAGITIGQERGKDIVFDESLAMSIDLKKDAFPRLKLSRDEALNYLRRGNIVPPEGLEHGYVIVEYDDLPLGFVKNIGSRTNNLYPTEWRIRNQKL